MTSPIETRAPLILLLLFLGIAATLVYDFSESIGAGSGNRLEWAVFTVALVLRLFTYIVLFASCRLLAGKLAGSRKRTLQIATAWSLSGCGLAAFVWWQMAFGDALYYTPAIKRFTPDTQAGFAPGWTIAEVALGRARAAYYTWVSAIGGEFAAIALASLVTAFFLAHAGKSPRARRAALAPFVAFLVLLAYALIVGWSFDWDFDIFIGDALIGAMVFNGVFFVGTILYGNFASPSVWVALIAATNVAMLHAWKRADP